MGTCLSKPREEAKPEAKYAVHDPAPVAKTFETKDVVASAIPVAVAAEEVVEDSAPVPAGAPPTELIGNLIDPISGELAVVDLIRFDYATTHPRHARRPGLWPALQGALPRAP